MKVKDHFLTGEQFEVIDHPRINGVYETKPVPDDVSKYYASADYDSHKSKATGLKDILYNFLRSRNNAYKYDIISRSHSNGRLLDYGCGVGAFASFMQRKGFEIKAFDLDSGARRAAATRIGEENVIYDDPLFSNNHTFDVICLWHVLEHLNHPAQKVKGFFDLLKPGGSIYIALPNPKSYDADVFKEHWAAWDVPRHLVHFEPEGIKALMKEGDFTFKNQYPLFFDSFYVSWLSAKYAGYRVPLLQGLMTGFKSNRKAKKSGNYSSLIYHFEKS